MSRERREFGPQFKAEAVQLVVTAGWPVAGVARELQINEGTLGNWVKTRGGEILNQSPRAPWSVHG